MRVFRVAALLVSLTGLVRAGVIFSTYAGSNENSAWYIDNDSATNRVLAEGFTMPGSGAYSLDSVKVRLQAGSAANPPVAFSLFANGAGIPTGSALVTFNPLGAIPADTTADYTLTPTSSFTLQPATTYWLVADGAAAGPGFILAWVGSAPPAAATGVATAAGYYAGVSKFSSNINGTDSYDLEVNATLVAAASPAPEPGTLALASLALGAFLLRRRTLRTSPSAPASPSGHCCRRAWR